MNIIFKLILTCTIMYTMFYTVGGPLVYILLQIMFFVSLTKLVESVMTKIDTDMRDGK